MSENQRSTTIASMWRGDKAKASGKYQLGSPLIIEPGSSLALFEVENRDASKNQPEFRLVLFPPERAPRSTLDNPDNPGLNDYIPF